MIPLQNQQHILRNAKIHLITTTRNPPLEQRISPYRESGFEIPEQRAYVSKQEVNNFLPTSEPTLRHVTTLAIVLSRSGALFTCRAVELQLHR